MSKAKWLVAITTKFSVVAGQSFREGWKNRRCVAKGTILAATLTFLAVGNVTAANDNAEIARGVGERAPLFSAVTSQDALIDYNRDFYGQHHLVLTFFPAAFTPV